MLEHWQQVEEKQMDNLQEFLQSLAAEDYTYEQKFSKLEEHVKAFCSHHMEQCQVLVTEGKALLGTHPKDLQQKDFQDDPPPKRTRSTFGGSSSSQNVPLSAVRCPGAAEPAVEVVSSDEERVQDDDDSGTHF